MNGLQYRENLRKALGNHFSFAKIAIMNLWCQLQKPDERLVQLKNKHQGERCFIVATGPSLTMEDVEKLKGEWTFSMNSCVNFLPDTTWRPDFYLCFDPEVYLLLKEKIQTAELNTIFYNSFSIPHFCRDAIPCIVNSSNITYSNSRYGRRHPKPAKVSLNGRGVFYEGTSTVFSAIQLAIYMGFKKIYLLGCDCNYQKQKHASFASYDINTPVSTGERMVQDYFDLQAELTDFDIQVYNATRGGMLEVFQRVNLDQVLLEKNMEGNYEYSRIAYRSREQFFKG